MRIFASLASALCLAGCQPPAESPPPRVFTPDTSRVVAADSPPDRMRVCMHIPDHNDRWTPDQEEIDLLNPVLIELIEYRLKEDNLTYEDSAEMQPTEYHRDYFGLMQGDRRLIVVCGRYGEEPIYMMDGGPSQFAALYDATRRTFEWFEFGHRA